MFLALGLSLAAGSGCLQNLNEQKYFDTLQRSDPALASRVREHKEEIEAQLDAALRAKSGRPIDEITMWGAGWETVRQVVGSEGQLFMRGRIFHPEGPASPYYAAYTVEPDGHVVVYDARVYGHGAPPSLIINAAPETQPEPEGGMR